MKPMSDTHLAILRRHMVELIEVYADLISDETGRAELNQRVLAVMRRVPRHLFVPPQLAGMAYQDTPLPIGFDKTISQPFICAMMVDLLDLEANGSILEIGTGLGYLTALIAELTAHVWTVEIVEEFGSAAESRLDELGYRNVVVRIGDGSRGWADHAPFDKILVSAAAANAPPALVDQLKPGGRMVMPIGAEDAQQITIIDKSVSGELFTRAVMSARFSRLET